jgi:putative ABC transport system permease protein
MKGTLPSLLVPALLALALVALLFPQRHRLGLLAAYNLRNLRVRWQVTLLAVGGVALVVAVFVFLGSMSNGFRQALRATGRADNAIVVQKGSQSELTSGILREKAALMAVDARVARGADGQPLASPEILVVANFKRLADGADVNVSVRGVTARAFEVRGGLRFVAGRAFQPGLDEIVVGERVRERFGFDVGSKVTIQRRSWTVAGVFASEGSGFESEIWGDLDVMAEPLRRTGGYQVLVLRLGDPGQLEPLRQAFEGDPQQQVSVHQERAYYEAQAGATAGALRGLALFVSVVMAIGAIFGAMNTMYAIVAARTREIGTLRALGFSRRMVLSSFVVESVALALVGGILGCLLALPAGGLSAATGGANFSELAFAFRVTPRDLVQGLVFAAVMGLLGGLLPALRAARLPITLALRES